MTYEKRLERAKEYYYDGGTPEYTKFVLKDIFPELRESEDERIKREIVRYINLHKNDERKRDEWIAYLEKQGKQSVISHKFNVGD